jgi:ABC-2 type transport system ATP-binding protein
VLDGEKNAIRQQFRDNTFELRYSGTLPDLSEYAEILSNQQDTDHQLALIRPSATSSKRGLISKLNDNVELISFAEKLPTFNDIFIKTVKESSHE